MARRRPDPYAPNEHGILYRWKAPSGFASRPVRAKSALAARTPLALVFFAPQGSELQAWDHAAQSWRKAEG